MIDKGKHNVLGILVNAIDYEAAVAKIIAAAKASQPCSVSALAVHGIMTGAQDATHRYRLNRFDLIVPDGQPVRWALNLLHHTQLADRVYGPNLTLKVCEQAAQQQLPIYLYGSKPDVLERLEANLRRHFPDLQIAGKQPSRFRHTTSEEKMSVVNDIRHSGARITLVGLGCPRQEVWAYEYSADLGMPVMAVGAAFDFHAGTLAQAPSCLQKMGMEWLFRLTREPKRLWRRYIILNPQYLGLLALQVTKLHIIDPASGHQPMQPVLYG
jgi:N-acetylglucosaminyldiphosphoundecaprenol N-acetyl-beta-D-mannosaminyltransferase